MHKKVLVMVIAVLLGVSALSGCTPKDEKTRIKEAMIDVACNLLKPFNDKTKNMDMANEEAMKQLEAESLTMEAEMTKIIQKHGFKDQAEIEEVSKKYKDDKTFEEDAMKAIKDTCGFDMAAEGFN